MKITIFKLLLLCIFFVSVRCANDGGYIVEGIDSNCNNYYHVISVKDASNKKLIVLSKKINSKSQNEIVVGEKYKFIIKKIDEPLIQEISNGDTTFLFSSSRANAIFCNSLRISQLDSSVYYVEGLVGLGYKVGQ